MKKILKSRHKYFFRYSRKTFHSIIDQGKFDEVGRFYNNLAYVKKDSKYGYVNFRGKVVIPIIYHYASNFYTDKVFISKGWECMYLCKNGKEIPLEFICDNGQYKFVDQCGIEVCIKDEELDPLYNDTKEIINNTGKTSMSYIQRTLGICFTRTNTIFRQLVVRGDFPSNTEYEIKYFCFLEPTVSM